MNFKQWVWILGSCHALYYKWLEIRYSLDVWHTWTIHWMYIVIFIEELLIDFCELVGKHLGKNLADAVWQTKELYGLQWCVGCAIFCSNHLLTVDQVIAINCDNASNNDTMAEALEICHQAAGLEFDAQESHLAACCTWFIWQLWRHVNYLIYAVLVLLTAP